VAASSLNIDKNGQNAVSAAIEVSWQKNKRLQARGNGDMNERRIFSEEMKARMIAYKTDVLGIDEKGERRGREYDHILPSRLWDQNLWSGIRRAAVDHFSREKIKWHDQRDNLLSSQILCVNIFFGLKRHPSLLNGFLKSFYPALIDVTDIDFEYNGREDYLNEKGGRGYNRTSADVAITWEDTKGKNNLLLVEFKFTEPNFGECGKSANPDRNRCNNGKKVISSPKTECYRASPKVDRPYWDMILSPQGPFIQEMLNKTPYCPFRYDFYQLMRNQLLAHHITEDKGSGFYFAEFAVCYDERNKTLLHLSHPVAGDTNPFTNWKSFLKNPSSFKHFTIQQLLGHIENADNLPSELEQWRVYLNKRYGL